MIITGAGERERHNHPDFLQGVELLQTVVQQHIIILPARDFLEIQ